MLRLFAITTIFFHLLTSFSTVITLHSCMNRLKSVSINETHHESCCGVFAEEMGCCENEEYVIAAADVDFLPSSGPVVFNASQWMTAVLVTFTVNTEPEQHAVAEVGFRGHAPPLSPPAFRLFSSPLHYG
ncbi:MAG: hypothetical protein AAGB22_04065 [Bacteroidota bacterium]